MSFKDTFSLNTRHDEASRILAKYPGRIPIICETDIKNISRMKYLVPNDLTIGKLMYVFRKRLQIPYEKALFMTVNNIIPPTSARVSDIYNKHKDENLFIYFFLSYESAFG
jgi:GABA(A) receptor-associated protein